MEQDWTAVYPSAMPFRPNAVPLPVRMGYPVKGGVPPEKQGNLELIKVSSKTANGRITGLTQLSVVKRPLLFAMLCQCFYSAHFFIQSNPVVNQS